jgi:drug/metabolite transporter (DMT)-like permease
MNKPGEVRRKKFQVILAYFLIYFVWGSTYYFIGVALKGIPTFLLGAIRFSGAGILLLAICAWRGEPISNKALIKKSAISGILLLFIDMTVVMIAERYVSSSVVAITASTTAIWIILLDFRMWKLNFRNPFVVVGTIMGFFGVLLLYVENYLTDGPRDASKTGMAILLFGCISWAFGTLYTKYQTSKTDTPNMFAGSAWQMIFAGAMFWISSLIFGEIQSVYINKISIQAWLSLVYLIVFGSLLAYSAYIWLLKVRSASEVATHAYVNPFVAVFIGSIFGAELIGVTQIIGLVVIIMSTILINLKKSAGSGK